MKQDRALEILKSGQNVFLTGSAGTGKTFLLNKFIEYLKKEERVVGITASTGVAATQLNGRTIHSWSGIKIEKDFNEEVKRALKSKKLQERVIHSSVLIIDEISMFDAQRLDLVDRVLKTVRKSKNPFGGLQVVLCGDFFQLPPIKDKNFEEIKREAESSLFSDNAEKKNNFAYQSSSWQSGDFKICYLEEQYRQQKDRDFTEILNKIRENKMDNDVRNKLEKRMNKEVEFVERVTKLYTHNADVDDINNYELSRLPDEEVFYTMTSDGPEYFVKYLKKNCLSPETLVVKKGAIVMFLKNNFTKGYVNGTIGVITGFDDFNYPIVRIKTGQEIVASPESWAVEDEGKVLAKISQVPLRLAWAITVHKSQGMSLDAAEIDLSKCFELGMGYVALSRVRSLDGIKLMGINEVALRVNEDVVRKDKEFKELSKKLEKIVKKRGRSA
ncbi:MAG TPA: PIF1 family DEAD/DEAH box helicase [Candidatus Paceibacterota bacterium]|nr:PIF1 family DEAD/DEAH box helicase [Candidatus Paceibacterota bacterium]